MTQTASPAIPQLNSRQKQLLKGLAHPRKVTVQIGKEGLTESITKTVAAELRYHELIKIKIGNNSGLEKHDTAQRIASATKSVLVQLIGKTIILYKANPELAKEKRIRLSND